jgi:hypothetical protein
VRAVALLVVACGVGCGRINFNPLGDGGAAHVDASGDGPFPTANHVFVTRGSWNANFATSNAIDRLAGSRGWVRMDGEPVVDLPADILTAKTFNPITLDADGAPTLATVWTGRDRTGKSVFGSCMDWTTGTVGITGIGQNTHALPG